MEKVKQHSENDTEYYSPRGEIYGIANTISFLYVEDNFDPYLNFEATIHNNDIFYAEQATENNLSNIVTFEHSSYSSKDRLGNDFPSGGMYAYKQPDCDIPNYSLNKVLENYTPISKSQYEHLSDYFKQMEQIGNEISLLKDAIHYINAHQDVSFADIESKFSKMAVADVIESFNGNGVEEFKDFLEKNITADKENIKDLYNDFLNDSIIKDNEKEHSKANLKKGNANKEYGEG